MWLFSFCLVLVVIDLGQDRRDSSDESGRQVHMNTSQHSRTYEEMKLKWFEVKKYHKCCIIFKFWIQHNNNIYIWIKLQTYSAITDYPFVHTKSIIKKIQSHIFWNLSFYFWWLRKDERTEASCFCYCVEVVSGGRLRNHQFQCLYSSGWQKHGKLIVDLTGNDFSSIWDLHRTFSNPANFVVTIQVQVQSVKSKSKVQNPSQKS